MSIANPISKIGDAIRGSIIVERLHAGLEREKEAKLLALWQKRLP